MDLYNPYIPDANELSLLLKLERNDSSEYMVMPKEAYMRLVHHDFIAPFEIVAEGTHKNMKSLYKLMV